MRASSHSQAEMFKPWQGGNFLWARPLLDLKKIFFYDIHTVQGKERQTALKRIDSEYTLTPKYLWIEC